MRDFLKNFFGGADEDTIAPVDSANAVRKSVTVAGRVQGVGFRYFVRQEAHALGVTGWVMNLNDGTVTMEIQAPPAVIDTLLARLKKGNGFSKIVKLEINDAAVIPDENKFGIKY